MGNRGLTSHRYGMAKEELLKAEKQYLKAISTIEQARQSINHEELRLSFSFQWNRDLR